MLLHEILEKETICAKISRRYSNFCQLPVVQKEFQPRSHCVGKVQNVIKIDCLSFALQDIKCVRDLPNKALS